MPSLVVWFKIASSASANSTTATFPSKPATDRVESGRLRQTSAIQLCYTAQKFATIRNASLWLRSSLVWMCKIAARDFVSIWDDTRVETSFNSSSNIETFRLVGSVISSNSAMSAILTSSPNLLAFLTALRVFQRMLALFSRLAAKSDSTLVFFL